jgi:HD superfamily phosphohydrolase
MEVRDPVHGSISLSAEEEDIIETPEFQRLRSIKQLGFSEFSFPAATHNRYLHSIGVCHLAGRAFDHVFASEKFSSELVKKRLRQCFRAAALLHDVGHGPLSHVTEEVMPPLKDLDVKVYNNRSKAIYQLGLANNTDRKANHEDYTIRYITDSPLSEVISKVLGDILPIHIVCLIDKTLACPDDFFINQGLDYRPILSQLVSSELDVDRMDYLERDSYFCGTNYGNIDVEWLLSNLKAHRIGDQLYLALNRRALYTFDDFLLSRHHMNLMVYFHHKGIIYEEMLIRYLESEDCDFSLPSNIIEYTRYNDYHLFEHIAKAKNPWAQRIAKRAPFRNLIELHNVSDASRPKSIKNFLERSGIESILASSQVRLSKYHTSSPEDKALKIYVVDQYDRWEAPMPIEQSTKIFKAYEDARVIDRVYVAPESYERAEDLLKNAKI